jgi:hypothetical protein
VTWLLEFTGFVNDSSCTGCETEFNTSFVLDQDNDFWRALTADQRVCVWATDELTLACGAPPAGWGDVTYVISLTVHCRYDPMTEPTEFVVNIAIALPAPAYSATFDFRDEYTGDPVDCDGPLVLPFYSQGVGAGSFCDGSSAQVTVTRLT